MADEDARISATEQHTAQHLRAALADISVGDWIPGSKQAFLRELEWFLGSLLRELPGYWQASGESLDGILAFRVDKIGELTAELFGSAILITDQSVVPLHLQLQLAETDDAVTWLHCRLGEVGPGAGKMNRALYASGPNKRVYVAVMDQRESLDWAYVFGYGTRRDV